jgi:hypothetical protein
VEQTITVTLKREDAQLVLSRIRQLALSNEASYQKYGDTFRFSKECGERAAIFGRVAAALDTKLEQVHVVGAPKKMCSPDCAECQMAAAGDRMARCPSWEASEHIKEVCASLA